MFPATFPWREWDGKAEGRKWGWGLLAVGVGTVETPLSESHSPRLLEDEETAADEI